MSVYFSFWLYSPRSLSNLLIEPDMPSLDMYVDTQKAVSLWLNGKEIDTPETKGGTVKVPNVLLEKGWNHLILKMEKQNDPASLALRFQSEDSAFLKKMLSSVVK
jgi:beta-galactosidase